MKAILLGLYHHPVDLDEIKEIQKTGVQIWTLNDFYMFYPFLMPDAIFQIHNPEWLPSGVHGRWGGSYRDIYNNCECPVFACWPDVGLDHEILIDDEMMKEWFPLWIYQCSVVYMLAVALHQGLKEVEFVGMQFVDDGERLHQVPYVIRAVNEARKQGLIVTVAPETEAAWVDCSVDWRCAEDLQPYHAKEAAIVIDEDRLMIDLP